MDEAIKRDAIWRVAAEWVRDNRVEGQPLPILPLLRQAFPGWVDEAVLAVRLLPGADGSDVGDWGIAVTRYDVQSDEVRRDAVVLRVLAPWFRPGKPWSFERDEDPLDDLLEGLVDTPEGLRMLVDLKVFSPRAEGFLAALERQVLADRLSLEADHGVAEDARQLKHRFLVDWIDLLSAHLAGQADLVEAAVRALKTEPATGVRGDGLTHRWAEIVREAEEPSALREGFDRDVQSVVWSVFSALPRPIQMALWFRHGPVRGQFRSIHDWDLPSEPVGSFQLHDVHEVVEALAQMVWARARRG